MTERATWKASERRMAGILGGERVPVTGRERGHAPDIDGVSIAGRRVAIEHKYGERIISARVHTAWEQARAAMTSPSDIPVVTIEETGLSARNLRVVMLAADDLRAIVDAYEARVMEIEGDLARAREKYRCKRCGGRVVVNDATCIACGSY